MSSVGMDESAASWQASTIAAAEAYATAANDAESNARTEAQEHQHTAPADGVDATPSASQRALDSFYANDPNRPASTMAATPGDGRIYLSPEDAQLHQELGFQVQTDAQGNSYLPPQEASVVVTVKPEPIYLPGPDHTGATASGSDPAIPTEIPLATPTAGVAGADPDQSPLEPERIKSGLGREVDDLLNMSPTLRQKWEQAKADGWKIVVGRGGPISNADQKTKTVYINKDNVGPGGDQAAKFAALVSHEIGHAVTPFSEIKGANEADHVRQNTDRALEWEGAAAFENARARDEIEGYGGRDIAIRGGFDDKYIAIYEQYKAGHISESEAKSQMADWMAKEPQGYENGQPVTKQELLERRYRDEWNNPTPAPPPTTTDSPPA